MNKIEQAIWDEIQRADTILLHLHPRPDPDSVGSALALWHGLRSLGKNVTVIRGDSPKPEYLKFLPGWEHISDQDFTQVDFSQFDLFIILDSGGLNRVSEVVALELPANLQTIVIDHHQTTLSFGAINYLDPGAAATAEMLFNLFEVWGVPLSPELARCLYLGLWGDTGGFKYSNTTARTLVIASQLVAAWPNFFKDIDAIENNQDVDRMRVRALATLAAEALKGDQVRLATLSQEQLHQAGIREFEGEGSGGSIANTLRSIAGCQIGVSILEEGEGVVKVSARSRDGAKYDVSKLMGELGGGGHAAAAGATVAGATVAQVRERLLVLLSELYPDLVDG